MKMTQHPMDDLREAMQMLKERGYTVDFIYNEGSFRNLENQKQYEPSDLKIEHVYRFEGESDPSDMSVLYCIETKDGEKGLISAAFGNYSSDDDASAFLEKVEFKDEARK
jgi:hypothetical protein